mgnify:CR=1 FL=1
MIEYLKNEVPHYLEDEVKEVKFSCEFEYKFGEVNGDIAQGDVYKVLLASGRRVFAVDGGFAGRYIKNVYGQNLPDAKTASKVHLYTLMAMNVPKGDRKGEKVLKELAEIMGLPKRYRRND